jgi:hypothetical protein
MRKSLIILTETSAHENHSHWRPEDENLQQLTKLKCEKRLTPCLELLESTGVAGDAAIFVLSQVKIENQGGQA